MVTIDKNNIVEILKEPLDPQGPHPNAPRSGKGSRTARQGHRHSRGYELDGSGPRPALLVMGVIGGLVAALLLGVVFWQLLSGHTLAGVFRGWPENQETYAGEGVAGEGLTKEGDSWEDQPGTGSSIEDPGEGTLETPVQKPIDAKDGLLVVLDAGHGGADGGSVVASAVEKEINLDVVQRIQKLLEDEGVEVLLTRSDDSYLDLSDRTRMENGVNADLFVSIHCNSYEKDRTIGGLECYHYPSSKAGKACAETLCERLEKSGKIVSRGVREENYYVLKNTVCAAVLVELGYLTNRSDRANLLDEDYLDLLAGELAWGILEVLGQ